MNVAIIGCGLIGRKRARSIGPDDRLVACCDTSPAAAEKLSSDFLCPAFHDYTRLLDEVEFDVAIVAVVNKFAKDIIVSALRKAKHVLAEKPPGRNIQESHEIVVALEEQQKSCGVILKTGFNHRFHPAIWKAKELSDAGAIGRLLNVRARYGHGGRPGMELEWRASKELCGGGELLDQGVHIIDLVRWFGGEVKEVYGRVETSFWNMEVEDNAFAMLYLHNEAIAAFHVSWTNWKNIFSFELFGTDGYLHVSGLGGSYGTETLEYGKRRKEGGAPDVQRFDFPGEDVSWKNEWRELVSAIRQQREVIGNAEDGLRANLVIDALYRSSKERKAVGLD